MDDTFAAEALGHLRALTARPDASFRDGQHDAIRELVTSEDFKEGPRAFGERRAPNWNPDPNARIDDGKDS